MAEFGPGTLEERVGRLDALGADLVRVTLEWRTIEATRGTYDWDAPMRCCRRCARQA